MVQHYFVKPEVYRTPADLTLRWKRWLLRRQRRVLPLVCVQITPWFARSWSATERCWTCRSSPSHSWSDICGTHPQVRWGKAGGADGKTGRLHQCINDNGTHASRLAATLASRLLLCAFPTFVFTQTQVSRTAELLFEVRNVYMH